MERWSYTKFFQIIQERILFPKVENDEIEGRLRKIRDNLPVPVFWLLGKAQSGKTSLIRALTGDSRATIGDGIRPCTRTSLLYDFPNAETSFLKFLDTRGLGEIEYDPAEDMKVCEEQSHILMVVMKAMDHAQQPVVSAVKEIHRRHPHWPLIVIQTSLHEGYPEPAFQHILPYPYHQQPFPPEVPKDLARSIDKQRRLFNGMKALFAPVDFTLPEDGYHPVNYGIEALWNAIETSLPIGLGAMLREAGTLHKELQDTFSRAAHPHILAYAVLAGGSGVIPIPFMDIPIVTVIQAKLFQTVASIYNQEMNRYRIKEVVGALGAGLLSQVVKRELLKVIPGYGEAVSSLFNAAATYALGKTLCAYFTHIQGGGGFDPKLLRKLYDEQFQQGRELLKGYFKEIKDGGS